MVSGDHPGSNADRTFPSTASLGAINGPVVGSPSGAAAGPNHTSHREEIGTEFEVGDEPDSMSSITHRTGGVVVDLLPDALETESRVVESVPPAPGAMSGCVPGDSVPGYVSERPLPFEIRGASDARLVALVQVKDVIIANLAYSELGGRYDPLLRQLAFRWWRFHGALLPDDFVQDVHLKMWKMLRASGGHFELQQGHTFWPFVRQSLRFLIIDLIKKKHNRLTESATQLDSLDPSDHPEETQQRTNDITCANSDLDVTLFDFLSLPMRDLLTEQTFLINRGVSADPSSEERAIRKARSPAYRIRHPLLFAFSFVKQPHRTFMILRRYYEWSVAAIADHAGLPPNKVSAYLLQGKQHLRDVLAYLYHTDQSKSDQVIAEELGIEDIQDVTDYVTRGRKRVENEGEHHAK